MEEVNISVSEEQLSTNEQFLCGLKDCTEKFSTLEELKEHLRVVNNHKAPAVPGAGPKCQYCEHKEKYQHLADEYVEKHAKQTDKMTVPFIQELAVLLDKNRDTVTDWAKKKDEHPEFYETIQKLSTIQELRLLQRTLGRYNPTGAIFQLKTNHGYVETEKKVVTGDSNAPLLIELIPEKPRPDDE